MGVDFEKLFKKGSRSYDTKVGDWWQEQSDNPAHRKAYRNIADYIHGRLSLPGRPMPRLMVDYACGNGAFLCALAERFPKANLVGLDGSEKMLERALHTLREKGHTADIVSAAKSVLAGGPRIRLVQTRLPNFSLPKGLADMTVFLFPNITASANDQAYYDKHGYLNREDTAVAKMLARFREMDPEDEVSKSDPDDMYDGIMTDRVVSRNLRHLLKKGGSWFKVDYANASREELSQLTQIRSLFSEGALTEPVKDKKAGVYFDYMDNRFFRSSVILDVFHQTLDPTDKTGGYFISQFNAV